MSKLQPEPKADRLLRLSEEVGRIATTLARISTESAIAPAGTSDEAELEVSAATVASAIRARRQRLRYLPKELFAEPAWDMLLALFHSEILRQRVPITGLSAAAGVPGTTALRYLRALSDLGLVTRQQDPFDLRRIFVELSPDASAALRRYFTDLGAMPDASA